MPEKQATSSAKEQLPLEEQAQAPKLYTEEQMRNIYNEGQKSGYIAAIKNIRSNVNDYLDSLIVAVSMNQDKGE